MFIVSTIIQNTTFTNTLNEKELEKYVFIIIMNGKILTCFITLHTIVHPWCGGHFTSISVCTVWGVRVGVQIFRRELHTHIYLHYVRMKFLSCKKKKKMIDGKGSFVTHLIN